MTTLTPPSPGAPHAIITATGAATPRDIAGPVLVDAFKTHGAILLRGFDVDMQAFRDLTRTLCVNSVFNESPGRELLDAENNIQTVNTGLEAFPLHPELSREPWKPDACFFWCMNPPGQGGETTVCDGVEVVKHLPVDVRTAFEGRRLLYRQMASPELLQTWLGTTTPDDATLANPPRGCPYKFMRGNGGVVRYFSRPALHQPMFTPGPAWGNFLLFARATGRRGFPAFENGQPVPEALLNAVKDVSDRLSAPVQWQRNDIIILDNTRFMHGRNRITDAGERRIATYFGYLKFAIPDPEEGEGVPWRLREQQPA